MSTSKKSSGYRLIQIADVIKVLMIILFALGGVGVFILFADANKPLYGIFFAVGIILLGVLIAILYTIKLRAFGELVYNSNVIVEQLNEIPTDVSGQSSAAAPTANKSGNIGTEQWRCSCGRVNEAYVFTCACGKNRNDV